MSDYYVTPVHEIENFLREFIHIEPKIYTGTILDPCAGGDTDHAMSYPQALKNIGVENYIDTIDVREDSLADIVTDYLTIKLLEQYDFIITNPPFNLALEIIEKALSDVKDGGYVIMLLRLNFFESKLRKKFFDIYMPKYCFVHHKRMCFTNDGKTDSIAYCHMVWKKGDNPEFCKLKVI